MESITALELSISSYLCMINAFFDFFVQKLFLTKNYFLIAEINFTTPGPLYTCLVVHGMILINCERNF